VPKAAGSTNPFRFGALALDEAFTDREEEIAELAADMRNGQDVVVFAPRRYGKSSLVWRVAQQLVTQRVLVAQVDLMRAPTKDRLAEKLAAAIHDDLATPLMRARDRLRVFADLRVAPIVTVDPQDASLSFSFDAYPARHGIDATLEDLLALPGRLAAERKRRIVLVLDEFQEVMDIDPGLIKLMRSVFQEQGDVAHVYLGSKRHMIERIFNDENEPFWRAAKQMELGPIAPEPFEAFAIERFAATGKRLRPATARAALEITGGHPYATQELLYFLWEERTLERALAAVLRSEHAHFSLLWERASGGGGGGLSAQCFVLEALAPDQPGHPLSSDYQRRHGLPSVATVQTALRALSRDGIVDRRGRGSYAIAEPFLGEWISLQTG
jgi:uncharacterized protein